MNESLQNPSMQLSFLTYNVWRDNSVENQDKLTSFFAECDADVIALQEVTRPFFDKLLSHKKISSQYDFVIPPAFQYQNYDGELLLTKKKFKATLYAHVPLEKTIQFRHLACGILEINGLKIGIGTAHLESLFFRSEFTDIKGRQLAKICEVLKGMNIHCLLFGGDCNLTGGDELKGEDAYIERLGLTDIWKFSQGTTDDYGDAQYRLKDVTWDGANNPNIPYKEFHRPDRIFFKAFTETDRIVPSSIERVVSNMSDHYGLKAKFQLTAE